MVHIYREVSGMAFVCWLLGVTRWGPVRRAALPQVNLDDDLFETEDDNSFEVVVRVRMRA